MRISQFNYLPKSPVHTQDAATLLVLQDHPDLGLQVLMSKRSEKATFAPGVYVFPGGAVDKQDQEFISVSSREGQSDLRFVVAAVRECFEELGILFAYSHEKRWLSTEEYQSCDQTTDFYHLCKEKNLILALDKLYLLTQWTTDRDIQRRFKVPFFVAKMPEFQSPKSDGVEQLDWVWVQPSVALAMAQQGKFPIIYPTLKTLEYIQHYASADALIEDCRQAPLWFASCPRGGIYQGEVRRYMESEAPFGELALTCSDGQVVHKLDWDYNHPIQLTQWVHRKTCRNPSMMTGPGTNTYILGNERTGYIIVDPGPNDLEHINIIFNFTSKNPKAIFLTHSHPDHAPATELLRDKYRELGKSIKVYGMDSKSTASEWSYFVAEHPVSSGFKIFLEDEHLVQMSLQVIETPG
ncbi:MAG: MBL fold metallo-hydrolase, partial [Gammaproteobacteria bacterium]|nr:MBL fold metallo-hydrolase [Gammaproteobacteria bacterium]